MSTPVTERGRAVTLVTAIGLSIGLMIAFAVLVLNFQGQGPAMVNLIDRGAQEGYHAAIGAWNGTETFLARVMYASGP